MSLTCHAALWCGRICFLSPRLLNVLLCMSGVPRTGCAGLCPSLEFQGVSGGPAPEKKTWPSALPACCVCSSVFPLCIQASKDREPRSRSVTFGDMRDCPPTA